MSYFPKPVCLTCLDLIKARQKLLLSQPKTIEQLTRYFATPREMRESAERAPDVEFDLPLGAGAAPPKPDRG